jgi:hypothetical protein
MTFGEALVWVLVLEVDDFIGKVENKLWVSRGVLIW